MTSHRPSSALRTVAAAAALAVAAAGGGLPMCASLVAHAAAPCPMHTEHAGSPAHHNAAAAVMHAAPSGDASCHGDSQTPACATGGMCPTAGSAAPVLAYAPRSGARTLAVGFPVGVRHTSFILPPLFPPPQA